MRHYSMANRFIHNIPKSFALALQLRGTVFHGRWAAMASGASQAVIGITIPYVVLTIVSCWQVSTARTFPHGKKERFCQVWMLPSAYIKKQKARLIGIGIK